MQLTEKYLLLGTIWGLRSVNNFTFCIKSRFLLAVNFKLQIIASSGSRINRKQLFSASWLLQISRLFNGVIHDIWSAVK